MSRTAVRAALGAKIGTALPNATRLGFDGAPAKPERIGAGGTVSLLGIESQELGVDLGTLTYHRLAEFALMVLAPTLDAGEAMVAAIGAAIAADRTLGGACEWLDAESPDFDEQTMDGTEGHFELLFTVAAEYSSTNPLD